MLEVIISIETLRKLVLAMEKNNQAETDLHEIRTFALDQKKADNENDS